MATTIELKNSVTTGNSPSSLAQGETGWNITDKKVWIGNASSTPIQLIGAGASMTLTSLTTSSDSTIHGLTVGLGGGSVTYNTAIGASTLGANTSGQFNTGTGAGALQANTTGGNNSGFGVNALSTNTTGGSNVAMGFGALNANTTASNNTAVGYQAGYSNTTGSLNTFLGSAAGYNTTTGADNVFVGQGAGYSVTTGNYLICLGYNAGQYSTPITTGQYGIYIGGLTAASSGSATSEIVIGWGQGGKGTNTGVINPGGGGVYQGNNSASWSIASDQRLKKNIVDNTVGLDAINKIQVRNFEYRLPEEVTELDSKNAINVKGVQLGAIAQELALILPDCVKTETTGVMSVDTTNITWHLINAVKELSAEVNALKAKLGA